MLFKNIKGFANAESDVGLSKHQNSTLRAKLSIAESHLIHVRNITNE